MPFDTTYHIKSSDSHATFTTVRPGGKDTTIELGPGYLPSDIDSSLAFADSIFQAQSTYAVTEEEQSKPSDTPYSLILFLVGLAVVVYIRFRQNMRSGNIDNTSLLGEDEDDEAKPKKKAYLTYYGDELDFTDEQLTKILAKRHGYFRNLDDEKKKIFLHRLRNFIADKTFKIHSDKAFIEMPVLISAAAIQLTFGLKKYLLPYFQYIHVYPQEFMRTQPVLCLLEGNVSGHRINLSWKHFLEGYAYPGNGQNVGLHELAHALYYQTFIVEENVDGDFRDQYDEYIAGSNKVYEAERSFEGGLYTKYGETNTQEFWAESIELFFERPAAMNSSYPELYDSLKKVLNQDPLNNISVVR